MFSNRTLAYFGYKTCSRLVRTGADPAGAAIIWSAKRVLASLGCVALPQCLLSGFFLNAGAKLPQDHKQLLMTY
jgi:hypothetical protein